jgi:hypothetical protein
METNASAWTTGSCFPLPQIDDTLDMLAGAKWFYNPDLKSDYWQLDLHVDDREDILNAARVMAVYGHALWPLQDISDI